MDDGKGAAGAANALAADRPAEPPADQGELPGIQQADGKPSGVVALPERRGPGRPKGSVNKATVKWRALILGRYGSPLERMAALYSMSLPELAAELVAAAKEAGLAPPKDIMEVLDAQKAAAIAALPFTHSKMPQQIDIGGEGGLVNMTFNVSPDAGRLAAESDAAGRALLISGQLVGEDGEPVEMAENSDRSGGDAA